MESMWSLTDNGFIGQYLIAGPVERDFSSQDKALDQLSLEGILRGKLNIDDGAKINESDIKWRVYAPCKADMIDVSAFYSTLKTISLYAKTYLYAPEDMTVKVRLWTYMMTSLFCNGKKVGGTQRAVYKPIQYTDVCLDLKMGKNELLTSCSNLGARDSRNILGLQVIGNYDGDIKVSLFEGDEQERIYDAWKYLNGIYISDSTVISSEKQPSGAYMIEISESPDYEVSRNIKKKKLPVGKFDTAFVRVGVETDKFTLERSIEDADKRVPEYDRNVFEATAEITSNNRGEFGFSMPNILARLELGKADFGKNGLDRKLIFTALELIEKRVDCADFELCGLFRLIHLHGKIFDEELSKRVKEVVLGFRYWMNMKGSDAMCFWSENHSLMFYMCAYEAGRLFPDEYFTLADMTGKELFDFGKRNLEDWISDVETFGFEEFLSSVYFNVTFAALLNVADFTDEKTSKRAAKILDEMFICAARHCFKGCMIAPMGRVYRGNIYPFMQGIQETIRMFDLDAPGAYGEGWGAFMHGSRYTFPSGLKKEMETDQELSYETGNAEIVLRKTKDYCITSVQSPSERGARRWENVRLKALDHEIDESICVSHVYTKSLNESFHGTSFFEPGTYGYQQHMWYAALSPEAVVFINHPGVANEESDMRPGYWFGNGVMPAIKQQGNMLGAIYRIPKEHPVGFVHIYLPEKRFDEVFETESMLLLRKDNGYITIWCSEKPYKYSDMIFDCELRVASRDCAFVVICGSKEENRSFEEFKKYAFSFTPQYSQNEDRLLISGAEYLKYSKGTDKTQYLM